jgi:hypothetical protein
MLTPAGGELPERRGGELLERRGVQLGNYLNADMRTNRPVIAAMAPVSRSSTMGDSVRLANARYSRSQ